LKNIVFTNLIEISLVSKEYYPKPAKFEIPKWYKETVNYFTNNNEKVPIEGGITPATIKRCMPVFDAITAGYIIYSSIDVYVTPDDEGQPHYHWPSFEPLGFHPIIQAPNYPLNTGHKISYPKWINPWSIKTPKGYSTLYVQPFHRESIFTILPGVVDTDTYHLPVNFPFILNDITFKGLIPAGTPIAQVIPFKRTDWKMTFGTEKDVKSLNLQLPSLRSKFFDAYKTKFRQSKEYK
jgi:hypothetical protein